jgi:gamma-glutamyltranspeptidase/glutathione hydrolase
MTPVIVRATDGRRIVAGGSGGPLIVSGVLQTLLGLLDFGLAPDAAVGALRIHDQWAPPVLGVEAGFDAATLAALRTRGHTVRTLPFSAAVQVVTRDADGFAAAADARKGGSGATW